MTLRPAKIGFWLSFAVSVWLFFSPVSVGGGDGFGLDKLVHATIFLALAITARVAYPRQNLLTAALLVAYVIGSEYIQGAFLPLRHFDWYDITADTIGLMAGILITELLSKKREPDRL